MATKMSRRGLLAAAASTAAILPSRTFAQTSAPIRILTVGQEGGALAIYAKEAGFFQRAGLNVEVTTSSSGSAILAALAGGSVDIGNANSGSVAVAVLSGLPFTIFADCSLYVAKKPTILLCVAPNSAIRTAKDLAGKTIGVGGLRNLSQAAPQAWLDKNGVDSSSVKFIELPYPTMPDMLRLGRVDAGIVPEPVLSAAQGKVHPIAAPYDAIGDRFSLGSYVATRDWIEKNRSVASRISDALRQTAIWANTHETETGQILADVLKLPQSLVSTMTRCIFAPTLELSNLQPSLDVMAKYGDVSKRLEASTLVTRV
jgi:NitT/TauT family transport system substrate-binding protein